MTTQPQNLITDAGQCLTSTAHVQAPSTVVHHTIYTDLYIATD